MMYRIVLFYFNLDLSIYITYKYRTYTLITCKLCGNQGTTSPIMMLVAI